MKKQRILFFFVVVFFILMVALDDADADADDPLELQVSWLI